MNEGDYIGLKENWYFKAIDENNGIVICGVVGEHYQTTFSLPMNAMIIKDVIGVYEDKLYDKTWKLPDFNKKSMMVDPYEIRYHFYQNGHLWINVAFYNTHIHGQYLTVRAELHPFNGGTVRAVALDEQLAGDKIAQIILRKLKSVDDDNELIFSAENEAIFVRRLRQKRNDHLFSKYIKLETCGKAYSEALSEQILSRINQLNFPNLITGRVSAIFTNMEGIELCVFSDRESGFVIPLKLLEKKNE